MTSAVDICNMALSYIGDEATVTNINPPEGSVQADHCSRYLPHALRYMLETRPWSFATKRMQLALLDIDTSGWQYAYAAPVDCVRVVSVDPPQSRDGTCAEFSVEAHPTIEGVRVIRTDVPHAVCRYVRSCKNFDGFSEAFCQALAYYLAHLLAGAIESGATGQKLSADMLKLHQIALVRATELDAQQSRKRFNIAPRWSNRYYKGARHG